MAAGTFTSRDTYAGRIGDILRQNRYTYAENNPVTYADPSGHISIKSAWNAVKTGAKTAASAARAVTSAVTAAVKTGASAVSNAIKGTITRPTVKLGHLSSKTVNQTPSAYAKVSGASRNQAVQQKAAKSAAWADLVGQPVTMYETAVAWKEWGLVKAAGYVDESLIGNGAMLVALKVKAAECQAYNYAEDFIHERIPEADVDRMLRGAGLMLGGCFKSFGGFMLALAGIATFYTGIGALGAVAGIFVTGAGASDMNQGAEEFFLGMSGDSTTLTSNGMSDLFYDGNDKIYHQSTGTAALAGSMLTPYVNAHAAKMAAGKPAVTEPVVTETTVAEAAGGTADDALEQAIAGTEGIEGGALSKGTLTGKLDGLTPAERTMVNDLLNTGSNVEIIPRSNIPNNKTPDFLVDGVKTELKTLTGTSLNTPVTRIQEGFKQGAEVVIIDGRNNGLTLENANMVIERTLGVYNGELPGTIEIWTTEGIIRR